MLRTKHIELLQKSLQMESKNNIISNQDNINLESNQQFSSLFITKNQKEFIFRNNKSFFNDFIKTYKKNVELKNELKELISEKDNLYRKIIKLESKINNKSKLNNKEINSNNKEINNNDINNVIPYNKRKRRRRKKEEIIKKYNCTFPNCDKIYPSKCSLKMHIRLKHQHNNI